MIIINLTRIVNLDYGQAVSVIVGPRDEFGKPTRNVKLSFRLVPNGAWREVYVSQEKAAEIGGYLVAANLPKHGVKKRKVRRK